MDNTVTTLKKLIREDQVAFFTDEELQFYLDKSNGDVNMAAYECLLVKSENSTLQISGLSLPDTSKYFLRLAKLYRPSNTGTLIGG